MPSSGTSFRESLRVVTRDYSLVVVAVMFAIFGVAANNSIIPSYHELQEMRERRTEMRAAVKESRERNEHLQDRIDALDDPYYIARWMIENLHYQPADPVVEE